MFFNQTLVKFLSFLQAPELRPTLNLTLNLNQPPENRLASG